MTTGIIAIGSPRGCVVVEANIAASTAGGARFHVIGSQGRHGKDCQGQHKNEHKGDESFGFHDFSPFTSI